MTESSLLSWIVLPVTILLSSYGLFTLCLTFFWKKIAMATPSPIDSHLKISVIIPVRNEILHIEQLLQDLEKQTFPKHQF